HWTSGKDRPQLRFLNEKRTDLTSARLALITALLTVLASGLGILGVNAPEEMR
ncbi:MAG: DALR anticodon-binding domain-containing protein, partial [Methylocella sp.]